MAKELESASKSAVVDLFCDSMMNGILYGSPQHGQWNQSWLPCDFMTAGMGVADQCEGVMIEDNRHIARFSLCILMLAFTDYVFRHIISGWFMGGKDKVMASW